jgi:hypothetical protein
MPCSDLAARCAVPPCGKAARCRCRLGGLNCADTFCYHASQVLVAQKVTTGVYRGVSTSELDNLAAETAASMTATHPDYALVNIDIV